MSSVADKRVVLVVDDEPTVRNFVGKMLAAKGYCVLTAHDGQEAAELFGQQEERIELVVTDIVMPRKSGIDLIRELRAAKPHLSIIAMSGYLAEWETELRGIVCLPKPFKIEALLHEIETQLGRVAEMTTAAAEG